MTQPDTTTPDTPKPVPGFTTANQAVHAYIQRLAERSEQQDAA